MKTLPIVYSKLIVMILYVDELIRRDGFGLIKCSLL